MVCVHTRAHVCVCVSDYLCACIHATMCMHMYRYECMHVCVCVVCIYVHTHGLDETHEVIT